MARYVDIENCEEFVDSWSNLLESCHFKHKEACLALDCRECLRRRFTEFNSGYLLPTADVRPERHGEWLVSGECYECSECGGGSTVNTNPYCWKCGAKMDGKDGNCEDNSDNL